MRTHTRFVLAMAASAIAVLSLGIVPAFAQTAVTPADAAKFMGAWALGLDTPQGAMAMNLTIKEQAGKVAGQLTSDMAPDPQAITDISKDGENLVLKYMLDFRVSPFPR